MISFTSAQLTVWLATLIYPLARILALIASSPLLGNRQVPARIKLGLGVMLTFIIAPTLDSHALPDPASAQGLLILAQQIVAGLMMGFSIRLIFSAIEMAGDIAGMQMGLGFANFFDPQNAGFTRSSPNFSASWSRWRLWRWICIYRCWQRWRQVFRRSRSAAHRSPQAYFSLWRNGAAACLHSPCNCPCR